MIWRMIRRKTAAEEQAAAAEKQQKAAEAAKAGYRSKEQRAQDAKRRAEMKRIEQEMEDLQAEETALNTSLSDEAVIADYAKMQEVCTRLEEIRKKQDELLELLIELEEAGE